MVFSAKETVEIDRNPSPIDVKVTFKTQATQTSETVETVEDKRDLESLPFTIQEEKATQTPDIPCFNIEKGSAIAWGKIGFDVFVNFILQAVDEGTDLYNGIRYIL